MVKPWESERGSMNGNSDGRPLPGAAGTIHRAAGRVIAGRGIGAEAQPRGSALRAGAARGAPGVGAAAERCSGGLLARLCGGFGRPPSPGEAATCVAFVRVSAGGGRAAASR